MGVCVTIMFGLVDYTIVDCVEVYGCDFVRSYLLVAYSWC